MRFPVPLRPWGWCVAWLILIWSAIGLLTDRFGRAAEYSKDCLSGETRLLSRVEPTGLPVVAALGTSRLKLGLPDATLAGEWLGEDIQWLQFSRAGGMGYHFLPVLDALQRIRPRLLLVQDALLLDPTQQVGFPERARRTLRFLRARVLPGHEPESEPTCYGSVAPRSKVEKHTRSMEQRRAFRLELASRYSASIPLGQDARRLLVAAESAAEEVVVFHMPSALSLDPEVPTQRWLGYLKETLSGQSISVVAVGGPMPEDHYYDGSHANVTGMRVLTGRMVGLIRSRL